MTRGAASARGRRPSYFSLTPAGSPRLLEASFESRSGGGGLVARRMLTRTMHTRTNIAVTAGRQSSTQVGSVVQRILDPNSNLQTAPWRSAESDCSSGKVVRCCFWCQSGSQSYSTLALSFSPEAVDSIQPACPGGEGDAPSSTGQQRLRKPITSHDRSRWPSTIILVPVSTDLCR